MYVGGSHNVYYQCWGEGWTSMLMVVMMCTISAWVRGGDVSSSQDVYYQCWYKG